MNYERYVRNHPAKSILGTGDSEQGIRDNSFRFVNTVAFDLRKDGHSNVHIYEKTSGSNSFGYASDILVIDNELYDCVSSSDTPSASVSFGEAGLGDSSRFKLPDPNYLVGNVPPVVVPPVNNYPPLPASYEECLNEFQQLGDAYYKKYKHLAGASDFGHYAWRRFIEHWKFEDMLKDV